MFSLSYALDLKDKLSTRHYIVLSLLIALISSISILTIGFIKSLILIFGSSLVFISILNTRYYLYILFFLAPFAYLIKGVISQTITEYGLIILFVSVWLLKVIINNKRINLPPPWFITLVLAYLTWLTISNIHAGLGYYQFATIIRSVAFFVVVIAFYDAIKVEKFLNLLWAMMIPYIIIFVYTIIIFIKSGGLLNFAFMIVTRQGDVLAPNRLGGVYMLFCPILLSIFIYIKRIKYRATYFIVLVMFIIGLVLTNTRSAYLGISLSFLYFIIISKKRRLWISGLIMLAIIYISIPQLKFLTDIFLRLEGGVSNRDLVWNAAIELFRENYIFGIGTNAFYLVAGYKLPLIYYSSILPILHNAHNYPIEMAVQHGIPGLLIILYIFYKFTKESIKCQIKSDDIRIKALSTGMSAVMFAVIARGMFEAIGIVNNGALFPEIYFWILMMYPIKVLSKEHMRGSEYIW